MYIYIALDYMQAVILAGGLGTRLRPLTYTTPKPLLPVMNEPMVVRLINTFPENVDKVVLAVSYMTDRLQAYFDTHDMGREVVLVEEKEPLGTGGAVKNVEKEIDDTFLVFNGDVISSIDMDEICNFHENKGGLGTISMWEVEDPTRFGIIGTDEDDRITRFFEKPKPEEVFSHWINAGVYVLEPDVLDIMEPGKVISIEREIFPPLAEKGRLYGFKFRGFWLDAGTPQAYLASHRVLLDEQVSPVPELGEDVKITQPVLFGKNCTVNGKPELGPYACLGNDTEVNEGARISNSVLLGRTKIGRNIILDSCIIGYDCVIEDDVKVSPGTVIADNHVLKKETPSPTDPKVET
jgi:mannose-1-phosphate guanylyltransferase